MSAPALTGWQWAKVFGLAELVAATSLPENTLRRVLQGTHEHEPLRQLDAIANATASWAAKRTDGAPRALPDWRALWKEARDARNPLAAAAASGRAPDATPAPRSLGGAVRDAGRKGRRPAGATSGRGRR